MKSTSWKDIAELIGIAAIVASLVFVGLQMRQAQEIAFAELQNDMIPARTAKNDSIIRHAEILLKANSGEELTQSEIFILEQLIDTLWADAFFGYQRWQFVGHPAIEAPIHNFADFLHQNLGARKAWSSYREKKKRFSRVLYSDRTVVPVVEEMIANDLAKLDAVYD